MPRKRAPAKHAPTREAMREDERDIGANMPAELLGEDDGDYRSPE